jgi:hypothetical protein
VKPAYRKRFRSFPGKGVFGNYDVLGTGGLTELAEKLTLQADVLLASRYAAASSLGIYLRYDCAGVPGTIVYPELIINGGATQTRVRGSFCAREQVRW